MEIKINTLAGYERNFKSGLGYELYNYIYFWGKDEELTKIKNFIIKNFKTYKHDETVKFNEHEVFLWEADNYFYCIINANLCGEDRSKKIYEIIKNELQTTFNNLNATVSFGKNFILDAEKIENFIDTYKINLEKLPSEKFAVINPSLVSFPKLNKKSLDKWFKIEKEIITMLAEQTLIVNGVKGKFKTVPNTINAYGFFKLRARKYYRNISLNKISTLKFC